MQKITEKEKYLTLDNFGVLNTKTTLKTENWLWFPSYGRNYVRTSYRPADDMEFFLKVTSAESHKIAQKQLSDLSETFSCRRIKQNCCLQDFTVEYSGQH
jgi:hypothetical protein